MGRIEGVGKGYTGQGSFCHQTARKGRRRPRPAILQICLRDDRLRIAVESRVLVFLTRAYRYQIVTPGFSGLMVLAIH